MSEDSVKSRQTTECLHGKAMKKKMDFSEILFFLGLNPLQFLFNFGKSPMTSNGCSFIFFSRVCN